MEENKVLKKLDIRSKWTPALIILTIVFIAIGIVVGFIVGACVWYGTLSSFNYGIERGFHLEFILIWIAVSISFCIVPFIVKACFGFIAKRCSLSLEEKQIVGTLKLPFSVKKIQMPIEKIDNIFTSKGIGDVFRGGESVRISSNSGTVKFHYVYNADEFTNAALKQIEKYKKSVSSKDAAPAKTTPQTGSSIYEKVSELQKLKDAGLMTEEQFEAKKQELISDFK